MLTIKNLTKHFDNLTIIDHLNLEIPEGKILTIVGRLQAAEKPLYFVVWLV